MSELVEQTLAELVETVATGSASCREIMQAHLDRIADIDDALGAFVSLRADAALAEARAADDARTRGEQKSDRSHDASVALAESHPGFLAVQPIRAYHLRRELELLRITQYSDDSRTVPLVSRTP